MEPEEPSDDSHLHTFESRALKLRHLDLWFDDGTIILVAQKTGFRVYRGLLASQSTIFWDMLAASSCSSEEIHDGCPIVQLTDSPHDLAHLLGILLPMSPIHYHMSNAAQPRTFEEASAIIRLADKYHIESVQDHALRVLQRYHFTSDFAAFNGPPDTEISVEPIHAIGAVNLARITDTPRMLPLALYKCCCLAEDVLRAGWKHPDGSVEHLAPADFERCSRARSRLLELHTSLYSRLVMEWRPSPGCTHTLNSVWSLGFTSGLNEERPSRLPKRRIPSPEYNIFHGWVTLLAEQLNLHQCPACMRELVKKTWMNQRTIWDSLPEIFGVAVDSSMRPQGSLDTSHPPSNPCEPLPPQTTSDFTPHSQFWFDDGNIILVAQHTGFRTYRGILAAQSTVFADIFASSESSFHAEEAFHGCPIVHLGDSHHDLAHLLRVLLPTSSDIRPAGYHTTDPELVCSFDEISSLVRLAHKYKIQSVQGQAIRTLQDYYFTSYFSGGTVGVPMKQRISFTARAQCIGVVNLARLTNTPLLLPAALYACCYLRGALLDGWTREDGSVEHLSAEDLKRCLHASITLGQEQLLILSRIFGAVPPARCRNYGVCAAFLEDVAHHVVHVEDLTTMGPLGDWSAWIRRLENLCGGCIGVLLDRAGLERRRIWDALPEILGITVEGGMGEAV